MGVQEIKNISPKFPERISDVEMLENMLSEPSEGVVETLSRLDGDIIILGVAGKMGTTLARMAKRASDMAGIKRRVIGVSRFTRAEEEGKLNSAGIETLRCDLLDEDQLKALPDVPNVVFMAGMKFGSTGNESLTWAMNVLLPGMVCSKYNKSKIVAFSSGSLYGLSPITNGGSLEDGPVNAVGEYSMSVLGRERVFEHYSRTAGIPVSLIRLNYAVEMRYGVLVDVAQRVWNGTPVDVAMGNMNAIWQADANAMTLQTFDYVSSPPFIINITGPEMLSVRQVALEFGSLLGKTVEFEGTESLDPLVSNAQLSHRLFGYPRVGIQQVIHWIADWISQGSETLGKPTHFEVRNGKY